MCECQVSLPLLWIKAYPGLSWSSVKGSWLDTHQEPVFMAVPKPILTEFGIHYRLESCALLFTCSCTNLPHIPAKTYSEHLFVNPRGKPLFQGKMILVLSGKAFILCERRIVEGDILPQHFVSPKGTFLNSKYPPWNYNLDVWVNWLWNIRRVIFLPALLIESIRLLPQIPWSLMVLFFQEKFHLVCYTQNLICINLPQ